MHFKNDIKNNSVTNIINSNIINSISSNIEEMYVNNDNDCKDNDYKDNNYKKYMYDNDFLFKEIVDNILGSKTQTMEFDSDCVNVELSISMNDDYTVIDYKQTVSDKRKHIIENYLDNPNEYDKRKKNSTNNTNNDEIISPNITISVSENESTIDNNQLICDKLDIDQPIHNSDNNIEENIADDNIINITDDNVTNIVDDNVTNIADDIADDNVTNITNDINYMDIINNENAVNVNIVYNINNDMNCDNDNNDIDIITNEISDVDIITNDINEISEINAENYDALIDNYPSNDIKFNNIGSASFFQCFDEELSINNVVSCNQLNNSSDYDSKLNELTTSYMFDNEDFKKTDVFPFDEGINSYEKPKKNKNFMGRLGVITVSAMMLVSGSWVTNIVG